MGSDVFFDADSDAPHMTQGKNATLRSYRLKTVFSRLPGVPRLWIGGKRREEPRSPAISRSLAWTLPDVAAHFHVQ